MSRLWSPTVGKRFFIIPDRELEKYVGGGKAPTIRKMVG